jgi:hypothetical protein
MRHIYRSEVRKSRLVGTEDYHGEGKSWKCGRRVSTVGQQPWTRIRCMRPAQELSRSESPTPYPPEEPGYSQCSQLIL